MSQRKPGKENRKPHLLIYMSDDSDDEIPQPRRIERRDPFRSFDSPGTSRDEDEAWVIPRISFSEGPYSGRSSRTNAAKGTFRLFRKQDLMALKSVGLKPTFQQMQSAAVHEAGTRIGLAHHQIYDLAQFAVEAMNNPNPVRRIEVPARVISEPWFPDYITALANVVFPDSVRDDAPVLGREGYDTVDQEEISRLLCEGLDFDSSDDDKEN